MEKNIDLEAALAEVGRLVASGDIPGALRYLNSRTPHRYTGLYRFAGHTVANIHGVDKSDPAVEKLADVPVAASYCAFTGRMGKPFGFSDSLEEEELFEHLSRHDVRAYCGVPVRDEHGVVHGTLCHWDYPATPTSDEMVKLMERVASLLAPPHERR